jgi:N-acetylneuraminic acid mutarotase
VDTWAEKSNFGGTRRFKSVAFNIGTRAYIGTGAGDNGLTSEFWEYDPALNVWAQKADLPGAARINPVAFSIGSKGYVGTGNDGTGALNDFWEYDPTLNTWTQKADFGGAVRVAAVGFSIGSKGYIGLGANDDFGVLTDFWEYDPSMDSWTQKASFPGPGSPRWSSVGFSIGGTGYVGTGDIGIDEYTNDFWAYDPALDSWTQKADFGGTPRRSAVGFSIGNKGYIGTGYSGEFTNDFWEYDAANDTWTQKADFGGSVRWGAVGFSVGDRGYLGTGWTGETIRSDLWEYWPEDIGTTVQVSTTTVIGNVAQSLTTDASVITWTTGSASHCQITVRNYAGQTLLSTSALTSVPYRLDLSRYAPGFYIVCLSMSDGATQNLRIEKVR